MPLETTTPKPTPVLSRSHPPTSPQLHSLDRRHRRPSTRCSFSSGRSASFSSQHSEIHRTLCAQDHDSFSYDTNHLKEWLMPCDLWETLPSSLRDAISTLQHAAAAVLTALERLEGLRSDLDEDSTVLDTPPAASPTPPLSGSTTPLTPLSPLSKPAHAFQAGRSPSPGLALYHMPLQPLTGYYHSEMAQLKKETLIRLRHATRKVEVEIRGLDVDSRVIEWWGVTKDKVEKLERDGCRLSTSI